MSHFNQIIGNYFFQINFNNIKAQDGITNANSIGTKISSKKSGYIPNIPARENRSSKAILQINIDNKIFIQFLLAKVHRSITTAASTRSNIRNNRLSPSLQSLTKKMNNASKTTLTMSQNIQLFSQDFNFCMNSRLKNKKLYLNL